MRPITILCAASENQTRKLLQYGLGGYGYRVITASSEKETIALNAEIAPDVIILDTDLSKPLQGFGVCQDLRASSVAPIFFLSARHDKNTKVVALNLGADDYITKPFDMDELEARIRAVLRRVAIKDAETPTGEIHVDGFVLNLAKRRVFLYGEEIHFTPTEYTILSVLAVNAGKVLAANDLLSKIWKNQKANPDHYLRVYVNTIRGKLRETVRNPYFIHTEPGIGYRFIDVPA